MEEVGLMVAYPALPGAITPISLPACHRRLRLHDVLHGRRSLDQLSELGQEMQQEALATSLCEV